MDFTGKKILILAGASVHNKVVRAAKEMGLYVIVTDYLEPHLSPAKQIADESWMYSITDVDAIVDRCRQEKVDAVLRQHDAHALRIGEEFLKRFDEARKNPTPAEE